ncbi:MAG TPA: DUF4351 domain-containing protein [Chthonomonadaceae bacterium]|nr:DUF4351 domain-containing protein [Chthonomonadaceae bacterium]
MARNSEADIPHDQLFKDLLQAFFREFMELFFPEVAIRLDFTRVTFIDKETFTDVPTGAQRRADLVAQVYTLEGQPEIILTHIEVESDRTGDFPPRMSEYYMMLRLRRRLPVYPIVVYLSPGAGGITTERYEERVFDQLINLLIYQAVGLPDLQADDYLALANPLGPALSALMKASRLGKVAQKYQSLRAIAKSQINDARKALLTNIVETYLKLSPQQNAEFQQLVTDPESKEVLEMISVYEQRGIEKGIEQGIEQGIVRGKRETLLRQLRLKFGDLPEGLQARIEALSDPDELDLLSDRIITAQNLEEVIQAEI